MTKPRLRDELFGVPPPTDPAWIVDSFPPKEDALRVRFLGPPDIDFRFTPVRSAAGDVPSLKARKFVELLKRGLKPAEAAHQLHTTVKALMSRPQAQQLVTDMIEGYNFDAKVRALLVRATQNKILLQAIESNDVDTQLNVMKQMSDDAELGMKGTGVAPPAAGLPSELRELLDRVLPKELPPAPVDAEFEDVKS